MVATRLSVLAIAASSIFSGVFALPHMRHLNKHLARDLVVERANVRVEKHVVVNQYGDIISESYNTIYEDSTPATTKRKPKKPKTTAPSVVEAAPTNYNPAPVVATTAPAAAYQPEPSASTAPVSSGSVDPSTLGKGLVYSPYHNDHQCKDETTIYNEMKSAFEGKGYGWVRIYGTDCDQVYKVALAAYALNIKLMAGVYDIAITDDEIALAQGKSLVTSLKTLDDDLKKAADKVGASNHWDVVALVNIGNEVLLNNENKSYDDIVTLVATARGILKGYGYNRAVSSAEVFYYYLQADKKTQAPGSVLCGADDIVAINIHPFFDQNCDVANSGAFLKTQVENVERVCAGKKVIVVETGWPSAGNKLNKAQPGQAEQATFLEQAAANLDNYIILGAYNEGWKSENSAAAVEKFWGIYGNSPSN